jgi:hypothetical protein
VSCAPCKTARTCAFHRTWLSFSEMGIRVMAVGTEVKIHILDVFDGGGGSDYHKR